MDNGSGVPSWLRIPLRLPTQLYRHGWGWVLGHRFLQLTHVGRRSGKRYTTVLEVVGYDRRIPEFVVLSGFGSGADWLRNVDAGGPIEITVGRSTFPASHRRLGLDEATRVFADYERRNRLLRPIIRPVLSWLLGWRYDGSVTARRRMVGQLPLIAFRPATSLMTRCC